MTVVKRSYRNIADDRCFSYIRDWVDKKIRHHLARASQRHGLGWKRWSKAWLYGTLGLFQEYRVAY